MCTNADLTVSCREYPHIDYGERAAEMLPVLSSDSRRPAGDDECSSDTGVGCVPHA